VDPADVDRMIDMCAQMVPAVAGGRVLRAFAGSRPLYQPPAPTGGGSAAAAGADTGDTREVSRTFTVLDHATRDGLANMFSIVGGKLTTCRQMAEHLVDQLAGRMGVTTPCTTATEVLPGADHGPHELAAPLATIEADAAYGELVCECELVTRGRVRAAIAGGVTELEDLRRALRLGYGPCQAAFCAWRAAGVLCEHASAGAGTGASAGADPGTYAGADAGTGTDASAGADASADAGAGAGVLDPSAALERFLEERWRGQLTAVWGDQARQALLNQAIYRGIFDLEATGEHDEAAAAGLGRGVDGAHHPDRAAGPRPATRVEAADPSQRVGAELVGESEGRTASRDRRGGNASRDRRGGNASRDRRGGNA
jgi:glycerol-3-phosphate dehydrogenase